MLDNKYRSAEVNKCSFWLAELKDLRCAIWDVRFKTEDAGLSECGILPALALI